MSLDILFNFLCTQHVSDINISIIRSLLKPATRTLLKPNRTNLQHTTNREQYDQCGNSTAQSQAPDDDYINVRNMLST